MLIDVYHLWIDHILHHMCHLMSILQFVLCVQCLTLYLISRYLVYLVKLLRPCTTSPQKVAKEGKSPYFIIWPDYFIQDYMLLFFWLLIVLLRTIVTACNSSPLKNVGWKTSLTFWNGPFSGDMWIFRVGGLPSCVTRTNCFLSIATGVGFGTVELDWDWSHQIYPINGRQMLQAKHPEKKTWNEHVTQEVQRPNFAHW